MQLPGSQPCCWLGGRGSQLLSASQSRRRAPWVAGVDASRGGLLGCLPRSPRPGRASVASGLLPGIGPCSPEAASFEVDAPWACRLRHFKAIGMVREPPVAPHRPRCCGRRLARRLHRPPPSRARASEASRREREEKLRKLLPPSPPSLRPRQRSRGAGAAPPPTFSSESELLDLSAASQAALDRALAAIELPGARLVEGRPIASHKSADSAAPTVYERPRWADIEVPSRPDGAQLEQRDHGADPIAPSTPTRPPAARPCLRTGGRMRCSWPRTPARRPGRCPPRWTRPHDRSHLHRPVRGRTPARWAGRRSAPGARPLSAPVPGPVRRAVAPVR